MSNPINAPEPNDEICRQRRRWRFGSLVFLFVAAGVLVWIGFEGWTVNFLPAQYVGYAIGGLGVLGLCGVNIWHGGPIDPRDDPTGEPPVPKLDGLHKGK